MAQDAQITALLHALVRALRSRRCAEADFYLRRAGQYYDRNASRMSRQTATKIRRAIFKIQARVDKCKRA